MDARGALLTMQHVHYLAGASGTGTSTRARALQRERGSDEAGGDRPWFVLGTDVIRAQLRTSIDRSTCPDLFGESFNLPHRDGDRIEHGVSIDAFARQCAPILRAVEAGVEYCLSEGWNVVVEGVHLVPGWFALAGPGSVERTVELLVVDDRDEHVARLRARDAASDGRRSADHYERNLDRIQVVQQLLVEQFEALRADPGTVDDRFLRS